MNQDWSDDEDNNEEELTQPDRDFPISDEEEEDDYDMYELSQLTIKKDITNDLFNKKDDNKNIINNNKKYDNKKDDNKKKIFSD